MTPKAAFIIIYYPHPITSQLDITHYQSPRACLTTTAPLLKTSKEFHTLLSTTCNRGFYKIPNRRADITKYNLVKVPLNHPGKYDSVNPTILFVMSVLLNKKLKSYSVWWISDSGIVCVTETWLYLMKYLIIQLQ